MYSDRELDSYFYRCAACEGFGVVEVYDCFKRAGEMVYKGRGFREPHVHTPRCYARTEANRTGHATVCDKCCGSGRQAKRRPAPRKIDPAVLQAQLDEHNIAHTTGEFQPCRRHHISELFHKEAI